MDLTLVVVDSGPLPSTPQQARVVLVNKIAYGYPGAPYDDTAAVVEGVDAAAAAAAAAAQASSASQPAKDVNSALMEGRKEAVYPVKKYVMEMRSLLNTGGMRHLGPVMEAWARYKRLREFWNTKMAVQTELKARWKLEEALFALDAHLYTILHGSDGILEFEQDVFTVGSVPAKWESTYEKHGARFLEVLYGPLTNAAPGESVEFKRMDICFLTGKTQASLFDACRAGDLEHAKKMAGVLATLANQRSFVEHVLRRMPAFWQATLLKSERLGKLRSSQPEYSAVVTKNLTDLATMRDCMPPLPSLLRMVHYGYSASGAEPYDESARIEMRAPDLGIYVGERTAGFWAQSGGAEERASAAPRA